MTETKNNQSLSELTKVCSKCGKCRSVCPVFSEINNELKVARGRISLTEEFDKGNLENTRKFQEALQSCLLCMKCRDNCPSGVQMDEIMINARRKSKTFRAKIIEKIVFGFFMQTRFTYNIFLKFSSIFSRLLFKSKSKSIQYERHPGLIWFNKKPFPPLAKNSALKLYSNNKKHPKKDGKDSPSTVAIFTGCLSNSLYPQIILSLINILGKNGISYILPSNQLCCGTPALYTGNINEANSLIKKNIHLFNSINSEYIATPCASCKETLKNKYPANAKLMGLDWSGKKVVNFIELLNKLEISPPSTNIPKKIGIHIPCHDSNTSNYKIICDGIQKSGNQYIKLQNESDCCGGGGLFSVKYSQISNQIASKKLDEAREKEISTILTECPGCITQLKANAILMGLDLEVIHPIQLWGGI